MIWALLFALQVQAAPLLEKWSATIKDGSPVAVFFDASSASLFVSVDEGTHARVDKFDLNGKLVKQGIAEAKGAAGALRAYFGKLYWIAGDSLWRFDPEKGKSEKLAEIPGKLGKANDLAVARNGNIYLGMSGGALYAVEGAKVLSEGKPITGLFLLDAELFLLRERKLETFLLAEKKNAFSRPLCKSVCTGLEKGSSGAWISAESGSLREFKAKANRVLLSVTEPLGRFGYVYDREPLNDSVIVPFPASKALRAYRFQ